MGREEQRRAAWDELVSTLREVDRFVGVVIVEGRRDVEALKSQGLVKPIFTCSSPRRSHPDLLEEIAKDFRSVVILTDFDEEGRDLNRKLASMLKQRSLIVDEGFRRAVGKILGKLRILTIESLRKLRKEM